MQIPTHVLIDDVHCECTLLGSQMIVASNGTPSKSVIKMVAKQIAYDTDDVVGRRHNRVKNTYLCILIHTQNIHAYVGFTLLRLQHIFKHLN